MMSKIDELIAEYADKLRQIYDNRTVGDYTFNGLLSEFAHEIVHESIFRTRTEYGVFNIERDKFDLPTQNWLVDEPIQTFYVKSLAEEYVNTIDTHRKIVGGGKRSRGKVGIKVRFVLTTDWGMMSSDYQTKE